MDIYSANGFNFKQLDKSYTHQLADVYEFAEVSRKNYLEKLSDGDNSFAKKGGIFHTFTLEEYEKMLTSGKDVVIGAVLPDGQLCGMVWYNTFERDYPINEINFFEQHKELEEKIKSEYAKNNVMTGKDIIVLPIAKGGLIYHFFRIMCTAADKAGAVYKTGEVYHIDGYEDETGYHETDLLNVPSFIAMQKTGGINVGTAPQKIIEKDNIKFYITPQVFIWDIKYAIQCIDKQIEKKWGSTK